MGGGGGNNKAGEAARLAEEERRLRVQESTSLINQLFDDPGRETQYNDLRQTNYDYNLDRLSRDFGEAERSLNFDLARRGASGGSSDVDLFSLLRQNYDDSLLNVGTHADSRAASLRDADERTRFNLLSQAQQDIDSASLNEAGLRQLQANFGQQSNQNRDAQIGDLLKGIALSGQLGIKGFGTGRDEATANRLKDDQFNTLFRTGQAGSGGTTTNIGR